MRGHAPTSNVASTKTFCRICPAFCGLEVITDGKQVIRVLPDKANPYNWRDFCAKGGSANVLRDHPRRLTTPMKRVGSKYVAVTYQQAVNEISAQLTQIRNTHGANSIATYIGNPGGLNGPGALFQSGFTAGLGTINNYTVGSIDQNNWHLVAREMYGCEMACLIPDVDHARCILLIGSNPADSTITWMGSIPNGWKRVLAAKENGADLIIVDPRHTPSTNKAGTHIVIRPGEDWAFLLGIIKVVFENGWVHQKDCEEANGVVRLSAICASVALEDLSIRCNVGVVVIEDIARRFALAETAVCQAATGVSQNRNGTLGEWLSHVLNLITGRTDRKGGRVYQPGFLKNYMMLYNKMTPAVKRRSRIGGYRYVAGGYPLAILPEEITTPGADQVRALIINGGNPVVSGPDGTKLDAALKALNLLICIDFFQRESHRHAHWLIPGSHFLERDELYALLGVIYERTFAQLGPAAIDPRDGIKQEWEFFRDLAVEMNVPFMGVRGLNSVIRASRWLARLTGNPRHAFGPRWIWAIMIGRAGKVKWKELVKHPEGILLAEKSYGHFRPDLQTPDGRIQAAPGEFVSILEKRLAEPLPQANESYPLYLVSRRRRSMLNSWLVETVKQSRTFGDYIDINPADASARRIANGQVVTIVSRTASVTAKANLTSDMPTGIVSMDHGWGSRVFDPHGGSEPEVRGVNRNLLVANDELDELSGTPNLNGTRVEITACR
jgi:formate dehydrogenase